MDYETDTSWTPYVELLLNIPPRMVPGINRYVWHGVWPGSFLTAVIQNDLHGAYLTADDENALIVREYVAILHNCFPGRPYCWGSVQAMEDWRCIGGLSAIRDSVEGPELVIDPEVVGAEAARRMDAMVNAFGGKCQVAGELS